MVKKIVDRIEWTADGLERSRQYILLSYPEYKDTLARALRLRDGLRVVDVGCGTGAYSRLLAEGIKPKGKIVGVDLNRSLLKTAKKQAVLVGSGALMEFKKGDAYDLPLPDNSADLSFCHTVLWILGEPLKALREMTRVVRSSGMVAASEPDSGLFTYYNPTDERYMKLAWRDHEARMNGLKKLYGYDFCIGRKIPYLFKQTGLVDIRVYGRFFADLTSDLRQKTLEQELDFYKWQLKFMTSNNAKSSNRRRQQVKVRLAGGMTKREIEEYQRKTIDWLRTVLHDPSKLKDDFSFTTWGGLIVTGRKP
ncbi:MAG: methyltransferase domain-containing protein [Candidatus Bathyarchaeia archaeon]